MDAVLMLDVQVLNMIAGSLIPLLVGLVVKMRAPSWLKATTNVALSAVAGGLAVAIAADGKIVLGTWLTSILLTFVTSASAYKGFYEPAGIAEKVQAKTAGFGIGPTFATPAPGPGWPDDGREGDAVVQDDPTDVATAVPEGGEDRTTRILERVAEMRAHRDPSLGRDPTPEEIAAEVAAQNAAEDAAEDEGYRGP